MSSIRAVDRVDFAQDANKVRPEDYAAHRWYRMVLSFPPHLVRSYLDRFDANPASSLVLDPFCGTGTTLVECKKVGIRSIGVERNPVAAFASAVKTDWLVDPRELLAHARTIAESVTADLEREGLPEYADLPLFNGSRVLPTKLRNLPEESSKLLLSNSISPLPLHRTLTLLDSLQGDRDERYRRHELLALARALLNGISNLEFGPEVGVGPPKKDAPVVSLWLRCVAEIAEDLCILRGPTDLAEAQVLLADSRNMASLLRPRSVDAVITSPPYPNEKDYTRTTRLESVLLGFISSKTDLRFLKRGLVRSNTRGVYRDDSDDRAITGNDQVERIAAAIEARRKELGKTSGFERMYHRVAKLYFGGMARHLADLRPILHPGAQLAYVVGDQASYLRVMIRTGQVLGDIARDLGYEVLGLDLFRTRLATTTKEQLREEVLLLRWPGDRAS